MSCLVKVQQLLQCQNNIVLKSQLSAEERSVAFDRGVICSVFGEFGDYDIAGDTVYRSTSDPLDGYIEGFYAPLLVATHRAEHPTVIMWEAALEVQNVGVLPLHPERGIDVAVCAEDGPYVNNLDTPHKLTIHETNLDSNEWIIFGGIPVQRADRALAFLADDPGVEMQWLEAAVVDAYCDGLASVQQLSDAVDVRAHRELYGVTGRQLVDMWLAPLHRA